MFHRWQASKRYQTPDGVRYQAHDITDPQNRTHVFRVVDAMAHSLDPNKEASHMSPASRGMHMEFERRTGHTYLEISREEEGGLVSLGVIHKAVSHKRLSAGMAQFTGLIDRISFVELGGTEELLASDQAEIDDVTAVMKYAALNGMFVGRAAFYHLGTTGLTVDVARIGLVTDRPWLGSAERIPVPSVALPAFRTH